MIPTWNDDLLTGVDKIDDQHKYLFALGARVIESMTACRLAEEAAAAEGRKCEDVEEDALSDAVYGLTDYVVEHFEDEEALMLEWGYPGLAAHQGLHKRMSTRVLDYLTRFINGERIEAERLANMFLDWLTNHIGQEDKAFVTWHFGAK
jgi:hemerythrin